MNKKILLIIINTIILFGGVCAFVGLAPFMSTAVCNFSTYIARLSSPTLVYKDFKETISNYTVTETGEATTTTSKDSSMVMKGIGSKDSKDDTNITKTPKDIAKLMENAEKTIDKSKKKGKTSEEAYFGGGTLITYENVQIQSKIPASFYSPDIKSLLDEDVKLQISDKTKPTILIYHSHTTEAYSLLDVGYYISSDARSNNASRNMVRVGDDLAEYLEKQGFNVIHDRTIHDKDYNSSYDHSRVSIEKYLEQYPTIDVTIDVHRDDITYDNKTKVKPTATINDKKAARLMIISGCEYGKVKDFPDWEDNLKFNLQIQKKVEEKYQGLMRPIMFSQRKYNMYETHYSFLLEVGTDANTLDEACYSARLFGDALGELLNEKYVR